MDIRVRLQEDLKDALRARDERRKSVIRMTMMALTYKEIEEGQPLDEAAQMAVLQREARRRQETIDELEGANRPELLEAERAELSILESYLPQTLTREEIEVEARAVIEALGAGRPSDMGAVMRELMPRMKGRADGRLVNTVVRDLLSQ